MINRTSQNSNNRHLLMMKEMEMPDRKVKGMLTLESKAVPGDRGDIRESCQERGRTYESCRSSGTSVIINIRGHSELWVRRHQCSELKKLLD